MQIRWLASASASCLHATAAIARGARLADARLAAALAAPAASLAGELQALGLEREAFFEQAVPLAADFDNNVQLAERLLSKLRGPGEWAPAAGRLAGWFTQSQAAFHGAVPGVVDELELRSGPLREQWEARGPGLLAAIRRRTEPGLLAEAAEVVLVYPVVGGAATLHMASNKVVIEAVLTNPWVELPEIVRLGWLLSTLHLDLPQYSESISPGRLTRLAQLAMLPVALDAAAEVELAPGSPAQLAAAIAAWGLADRQAADSLANALERWFRTYEDNRPAWSVALAALEQLLGGAAERTEAEK